MMPYYYSEEVQNGECAVFLRRHDINPDKEGDRAVMVLKDINTDEIGAVLAALNTLPQTPPQPSYQEEEDAYTGDPE